MNDMLPISKGTRHSPNWIQRGRALWRPRRGFGSDYTLSSLRNG